MKGSLIAGMVVNLFLIVDPIGLMPLFAAITRENTRRERHRMIRKAILVAFLVLSFFAVVGKRVLDYFDVGIPAVRIAGGILLFVIGLEMLYGRISRTETTDVEEAEAASKEDVGLTPLAIPLPSLETFGHAGQDSLAAPGQISFPCPCQTLGFGLTDPDGGDGWGFVSTADLSSPPLSRETIPEVTTVGDVNEVMRRITPGNSVFATALSGADGLLLLLGHKVDLPGFLEFADGGGAGCCGREPELFPAL